ncbi:MAG: lysoplasmalogenase [Fervidobacterium sp.]|uniref:lysoplasmalogenase n=1 Tax=Fervidobacterium sp. TaxID=1871331 RepID=UPI00404B0F8E
MALIIISIMFGVITIALKSYRKNVKSNLSVLTKVLTTFFVFLAVVSWSVKNGNYSGWRLLLSLGVLFGVLGDFFMEFEKFFLYGMLSFLVGHVFYIFSFHSNGGFPNVLILVFVLGIGVAYYFFIQNKLGKDKIPVLIYVIVISTMLAFSSSMSRLTFFGASLFFVSDVILAYDKYVKSIPLRDFLILSTYFSGQVLIGISAMVG